MSSDDRTYATDVEIVLLNLARDIQLWGDIAFLPPNVWASLKQANEVIDIKRIKQRVEELS